MRTETFACKCRNMYSVYNAKTDTPLIVYANAYDCAKAMGISVKSFYRYIVRIRHGIKMRKWELYEDEVEDEEE